MADLFISYARSTAKQAQAAAAALRGLGYSVWLDDELPSHRAYADVIEEQLASAKAVVVIWSVEAAKSQWVRSEADRARGHGKLVQLTVDGSRLPMPFDQVQCADLTDWSGDADAPGWRKVVASVADLLGAAATPRQSTPGAVPSDAKIAPRPASESERRHLTVLACNLVNATGIAAHLDPEEWHAIGARYRRTAAETVTRMGGHVAKSGDSLVAYFGFPEAREDAAECAVRAGLAVIEAMVALNEAFATEHKIELAVRIGVHTGTVVVAHGAAGDTEFFGNVPNIASHVQAAALPDTVVMTSAVHDLVSGLFVVEDRGAQPLEGIDVPIRLYTAISPSLASTHARGFSPRELTPFVGRDDEANLLLSRWERVRDGDGQLVLLMGEPGIGKTRLTEEFRTRIKADPHFWIECGGAPLFANTSFHAVTRMLEQGLGWRGDERPEERVSRLEQALERAGMKLDEAVPLIAELLNLPIPPKYSALELTPEQRRKRLLGALASWVFSATRNQPLVLVMEDLHWVDPSTMELIQTLAEQGATAPLMLVCTARPEFRATWPARGHHAQITLNRLNSRQTRELVAGVISRAGLAEEVIDAVITRTDGVPLFAEELTRLMLEGDGSAGATEIPATLLDSLAARLDRLGRAKEVAQLGSVLGREFSYELLRAVSAAPEAELHSALVKLADAELIYARGLPPDANYQFKHALILDAAYAALLKSKRRELHARVAQTIAERFPAVAGAQPEVLARHWAEAGETEKAIAAWTEAGQRAASRAAHVEAEGHLRRALDLLRTQPASDGRAAAELPLLIGLAVSLSATGGYSVPEVGEVLSEARAICDLLGNIDALFNVMAAICNFRIVAGDLVAAEEAAQRCEEISVKTGNPAEVIQAAALMGYVLHSKAELPAARERLERVVRLYAEHDGQRLTYPSPHDPLVISLVALAMVLRGLGEQARADQAMETCLAHARSLGQRFNLALCLAYHAHFNVACERYGVALEHAEAALSLCEANGYATWKAVALVYKGLAIGHLHDLEQGLAIFRIGMAERKRLGVQEQSGTIMAEVALLQMRRGDALTALSAVDEGILLSGRGNRLSLSRLHRWRAEILAGQPDSDPAQILSALREAFAIAEAQGAPDDAEQARRLLLNQT